MVSDKVSYESKYVDFKQLGARAKTLFVEYSSLDDKKVQAHIVTFGKNVNVVAGKTSSICSKYSAVAQTYLGKKIDTMFPDDDRDAPDSTSSEREDEEEDESNVDYDTGKNVLFQLVVDKKWDLLRLRLKSHPEEASTWVYRRDTLDSKKLSWRMLPIHRLCYPEHSYNTDGNRVPNGIVGNVSILQELVDVYPESVKMADDEGKLPLLLCCRNGASFNIISYLLDSYPEGIHHLDNNGGDCFYLATKSNSANQKLILEGITNFMTERRKQYGGIYSR